LFLVIIIPLLFR